LRDQPGEEGIASAVALMDIEIDTSNLRLSVHMKYILNMHVFISIVKYGSDIEPLLRSGRISQQ